MSDDPYKVLGLNRQASQDDIQKAYRKLAKKHHPDLNPGDRSAEENFKQVSQAYDLLGDEEKRRRFDRGEIDAQGMERPQHRYYREYADAGADHPYASRAGFDDFADADDIFSHFFTRGGGDRFRNVRMRGGDIRYHLRVDFLDAVRGARRTLTLPDGSPLEIEIPAGVEDGQVLRVRGKGAPGLNGGEPGDALIEMEIGEHPVFRREGRDIHVDLPISLDEAVLGGKVEVPSTLPPRLLTIAVAFCCNWCPKMKSGVRKYQLSSPSCISEFAVPADNAYVSKVHTNPVSEHCLPVRSVAPAPV